MAVFSLFDATMQICRIFKMFDCREEKEITSKHTLRHFSQTFFDQL